MVCHLRVIGFRPLIFESPFINFHITHLSEIHAFKTPTQIVDNAFIREFVTPK